MNCVSVSGNQDYFKTTVELFKTNMQVHIVKKTHMTLFQLLTVVAILPHQETIGSSEFKIVTHSPYVPEADGRLENLLVAHYVHSDYSLDSVRNVKVEDEFISLTDEGDIMNINFMSTEIIPDVESTGTYKMPTETESTESIDFSTTTASYDSSTTEEDDIAGRSGFSPNIVASLLGR